MNHLTVNDSFLPLNSIKSNHKQPQSRHRSFFFSHFLWIFDDEIHIFQRISANKRIQAIHTPINERRQRIPPNRRNNRRRQSDQVCDDRNWEKGSDRKEKEKELRVPGSSVPHECEQSSITTQVKIFDVHEQSSLSLIDLD